MKVFISHNKADLEYTRAVAASLEVLGAETWFDEWQIAPGQSIVGGIEAGLSSADVFMLLWSKNAAASEWVGTEWRAYLTRRVSDDTLRVVPLLLDDSDLPTLIQDYRGLQFRSATTATSIAAKVMGATPSQMGDAMSRVLDFIEAEGVRGEPESRFGIGELDAVLGEPLTGSTIIVEGPRFIGRTSLLMSMLINAVTETQCPGMFISLDSSERMTTLRLLANESEVNIRSLMTARIRNDDWSPIARAVTKLTSMPLEVASPGTPSLDLIGEAIQSSQNILEEAVPLVFIDDLQCLPDSTDLAAELRQLATVRKCCVIASCRRPVATDDAIWQSLQSRADCIIELASETDALISIDVTKNRHGGVGWFLADLDGSCSKVTTYTEPKETKRDLLG